MVPARTNQNSPSPISSPSFDKSIPSCKHTKNGNHDPPPHPPQISPSPAPNPNRLHHPHHRDGHLPRCGPENTTAADPSGRYFPTPPPQKKQTTIHLATSKLIMSNPGVFYRMSGAKARRVEANLHLRMSSGLRIWDRGGGDC